MTSIYSSTCFGSIPAHHQQLNDCSGSLWFYLRIVDIVVLWLYPRYEGKTRSCHCSQWAPDDGRKYSRAVFVVGPVMTGPTTNTARLSARYEGKTRDCHCSHWGPDDGREYVRNMLSLDRRHDSKLKNCCIWLVIYLIQIHRVCLSVRPHWWIWLQWTLITEFYIWDSFLRIFVCMFRF
jgi:hypothetical protein